MSIYANAFASDTETLYKDYIKHTMTEFSVKNFPVFINKL